MLRPPATLVVGGGIGGLSLARELLNRGLPVTVLERAPQATPVGAGIIINPNAMRVLERNGRAEFLRADAWPYLQRDTCDARGRLLGVRDYRPLYRSGRLAEGALVHRARLYEALSHGLPPGTVRYGVQAERIEVRQDGVRVDAAGAGSFDADVLVGADGIHSLVRRELFGEVAPLYMGYRSHRLVLDNVADVRHFTELLGDGQRIGLVPVKQGRIYVWTTFNSPKADSGAPSSADGFRRMFRQFRDARVVRLFAAVDSTVQIITTDVEELRLERWVRGRVALLGDAAHAMTPNIGQGAGMAMEDAVALADELATAGREGRAPGEALAAYERRRQPRVAMVMDISRAVGEEGQRVGLLRCWLRDRAVRRAARDVEKGQADLLRLLDYPI